MKGLEKGQVSASAARLKVLLPVLAGLFVLLAGWFAWSGWELHRDGARRVSITQARNDAVDAARLALSSEQKQLTTRLASPAVQAAITNGTITSP